MAGTLVALAAAIALRQPPGPPGAGERVVLYGDSLSAESAQRFVEVMSRETEADVDVRAAPGSAVCDRLGEIRADAAVPDRRPTVAVLQFAGNNSTDCTTGPDGRLTGPALAERYSLDMRAAVEVLAGAGARVVIVEPPPTPGLPNGAGTLIADAYHGIVTEWAGRDIGRVRLAPAGRTVTGGDGEYADSLPCLPDEGTEQGCVDGRIPVRSADRVHFCPSDYGDYLSCLEYSSGARRYADEMARVTALALDPTY